MKMKIRYPRSLLVETEDKAQTKKSSVKYSNMNLSKLGSLTAKNGFQNEDDIVNKFNNFKYWLI